MRSIVILTLMAGTVAIASGQPQPRFRADVDLLVVSAIVRDAGNALVRGLTRDDFELLEDGKPVSIATFAEASSDARTSIDDGRFMVLLLDNLSTAPVYTKRIKEIAHGFAHRMGPKDVMSVVFLDGGSSVTTQNPNEIRRAIDRSRGYGKAVVAPGGEGRHATQTIGSLATQLARVSHRRKVLVCIGPAQTFNVPTHLSGSSGEAGIAMRDTARANLTTYVIDPLGLTEKPSLSTRPLDDGALRREPTTISKGQGFRDYQDGFAFETGGLVFANTNLYEAAVNQVWEESGNYYLLGYEPARRDNRRHSIDVRLKKPDISARARRIR